MAKFQLKKDYRPYRMVLKDKGPHRFGGPAAHYGVIPTGTETPLHHFLFMDLSDPNCPVRTDSSINNLPLYYPLKYGQGGPEVQYSVKSNTEIQILYMSDEIPDEEENQYVQVSVLPESRAEIIPLEYEEARILGFREADSYFQPNDDDIAILHHLYGQDIISMGGNLIRIGGVQMGVRHAQDVVCRNQECQLYGRRVYFDVIAAIPPVPINGSDDFWYEFQGGDMQFCFGLCHYCGTVIAFNRAS